MIITISGAVGSGKTTVAKILAEKLSLDYLSVGYFMRQMADERGISFMELTKIAKIDPKVDAELDKRQIQFAKNKDNFILDSRLGFYFVPNSLKIFLKVDLEIAAKRVSDDKRTHESFNNSKETIEKIKERISSEKERYKKYYGIDFYDHKYFDLIIDTSKMNSKTIVQEIIDSLP